MEIGLTTNSSTRQQTIGADGRALVWKAWRESRGRFFAALALVIALVAYAVFTSPEFLARYNARFPDKPLVYSVYVWSGLFHYALQGLWVLAAFVLTLGGLAREKSTGTALFMLGLPVRRTRLFLIRAAVAWAEALILGLVSALIIPLFSQFVGEYYPLTQAVAFGVLMSVGGLAVLAFGLLLSEIFEGEFTTPVVGLCSLSAIFLGYKAHTLRGWNIFDIMSATAYIDPATQLFTWAIPWVGMAFCLLISLSLLVAAAAVVRTRDA
jgi:ABC-type transport system involved in multi-copper enzyme maturation permease subunit